MRNLLDYHVENYRYDMICSSTNACVSELLTNQASDEAIHTRLMKMIKKLRSDEYNEAAAQYKSMAEKDGMDLPKLPKAAFNTLWLHQLELYEFAKFNGEACLVDFRLQMGTAKPTATSESLYMLKKVAMARIEQGLLQANRMARVVRGSQIREMIQNWWAAD